FMSNMKHGLGTFIGTNGKISYGHFENDKMISAPIDMSGTPSPTTAAAADSIITQFYLNINDVLEGFPQAGVKGYKQQVLDLERLLLRYNSVLRHVSKIDDDDNNDDDCDDGGEDDYDDDIDVAMMVIMIIVIMVIMKMMLMIMMILMMFAMMMMVM